MKVKETNQNLTLDNFSRDEYHSSHVESNSHDETCITGYAIDIKGVCCELNSN
jgi:hypothetical protein